MNPDVHIIERIKRVEDVGELRAAGATDVVAEELEAWMEIAVRVQLTAAFDLLRSPEAVPRRAV